MPRYLTEDQKMNSQRQMSGQKNESPPEATKVSTLLGANNRDDNSQAPKIKPFPLDRSDEILSDMYINVLNMIKIIDSTSLNAAFKKDQLPTLKKARVKLQRVGQALTDISGFLDEIG